MDEATPYPMSLGEPNGPATDLAGCDASSLMRIEGVRS
jgi:hypothetical protein